MNGLDDKDQTKGVILAIMLQMLLLFRLDTNCSSVTTVTVVTRGRHG